MKDQHKHIKGYRDLTQEEIDLMNRIKQKGEELRELLVVIGNVENIDLRWLAIAETKLQLGLMAATRAVARPTTF